MKVLAISHAYVEPFTRVGLLKKEQYPDIELVMVIPKCTMERNPEGFAQLRREFSDVRVLGTYLNFQQSVRFYGKGLYDTIKNFNPDVIVINNEPWSSTAFETVLLCRMLGLQSKIMVYTSENQVRRFPQPFRAMERYVLDRTDVVFSVTRTEGVEILKMKGYKGPIEYLPLSVDTSIFLRQYDAALRGTLVPEGELLLGFAGRLVKEKGLELVIDAIKVLGKGYHLLVIGDGPHKDQLERYAAEQGVREQVAFKSNVFYAELPRYLSCLDALVLPSLTTPNWKEQFGRILIETMACETPVIGSNSGEIPVVIGDAGMVFREGDVEDLVGKVRLICNPELNKKLGKKGRERVLGNFSRTVVDQLTYAAYKKVLNESAH